ncbi:MAG: acetyl-CoA carboxylase biotin carboxyl carrier protein subunit [Bacteriovoracaceae bacterium]|nr:acetyl-CoA carboxylase biotin carboxyl carrier protein subunit [Bacteriovoracaceae bacterium]
MKRSLLINNSSVNFEVSTLDSSIVEFEWGGKKMRFEVVERSNDMLVLRDQNMQQYRMNLTSLPGQTLFVSGSGHDAELTEASSMTKKKSGAMGGLTAPMPGKVFKVLAKAGEVVTKGQTLLILEAMKMEHAIKADKDGKVKKILFKEGDLVQGGMALAELE